MNTAEARDGGAAGDAVQPMRHQRPGLDRARGVQTDLSGHGHLQGEDEEG